MAAIDKMYCHSYYEYDDLRKWAIVYYPQLLFYFYNITLDYTKWQKKVDSWLDTTKRHITWDLVIRLGSVNNTDDAIQNLIKYYKESVNYDCSYEQAKSEVDDIFKRKELLDAGMLEEEYSLPVMNTPLSVDRKLLWICPISCVRKYLEEQCGYKTKWYHKLFWRGKKYFD